MDRSCALVVTFAATLSPCMAKLYLIAYVLYSTLIGHFKDTQRGR